MPGQQQRMDTAVYLAQLRWELLFSTCFGNLLADPFPYPFFFLWCQKICIFSFITCKHLPCGSNKLKPLFINPLLFTDFPVWFAQEGMCAPILLNQLVSLLIVVSFFFQVFFLKKANLQDFRALFSPGRGYFYLSSLLWMEQYWQLPIFSGMERKQNVGNSMIDTNHRT